MATALSSNRADPRPGGGNGGGQTLSPAERRSLHRFIPRTLRAQLALAYIVVIVGVMAALGGYLVVAARGLYVDRLSDQLAAQARLIGDVVGGDLSRGAGIRQIDPSADRLAQDVGARVTIIAADGTVLGDSAADPRTMENHGRRPEILAARASGFGRSRRHSATVDTDTLYVAVPIAQSPGAVARVAVPLRQVNAVLWRIERDVAIAALAAAVLAAAAAVIIARRVVGPLDALRAQATAIAGGRLSTEVAPGPTRELEELGRAFNVMAHRLRISNEDRERSRLRLEATLANLSDGVVITDRNGVVMRLNAAAVRLLGMASDEAVGVPFVRVSRDHELSGLLREALAAHEPRVATVEHGLRRTVLEASAQPLAGDNEELGLLVLRDVTDLRRLERMRREFVANVSHELRTPLSSIRLMVETLEAGAVEEPAVAQEFLGRIVGEVDRLTLLVDELLDLARLESGRVLLRLETTKPADLLDHAVERLRPQVLRAGLTLEMALPVDLPTIRVDRTRIEQVVLNLLHNATKFTPPGGRIVVGASASGTMLTIWVSDTGSGVPPEELPRLFERFYKIDRARRSEGTGLGLAIAKHIVRAHGGEIWAESEVGVGATFLFTVPIGFAAQEQKPPLVPLTAARDDGAAS